MAKDVDRTQVIRNIRVRTALKNDGSWIHKSKDEGKQDKAGTVQVVETKRPPVRGGSYVLSAAKKFDDSANQENGEVIPSHKDVEPEGTTVESRGDTKPQALTGELAQKCTSQQENSEADRTTENKEENGDAPVVESNVEHSEGAAGVLADVHVEEPIQTAPPAKGNPEMVFPVEPVEQPNVNTTAENKAEHVDTPAKPSNPDQSEAKVSAEEEPIQTALPAKGNPEMVFPVEPVEQPNVNTTAENKAEHVDTPAKPSNPDQSEAKVSADVNVENSVAEQQSTVESKDTAEVLAALEPQEENTTQTEPKDDSTKMEDPAKEDIVVTATKVMVESFPETSDVTNEAVDEAVVESETELVSSEKCPPGDDTNETVKAVAEVESSETPANSVDLVLDTLRDPPPQFANETTEVTCKGEGAEETVGASAKVVAESLPEDTPVAPAAKQADANLPDSVQRVFDTASELPTQPAAEIKANCEKCPPKEDTKDATETPAEVVVETPPENLDVNNVTPGEASLLNSEQPAPVPPTSESPTQSASEPGTEEVVECQAQRVDNSAVEESPQPAPESPADRTVELNIEDAIKPEAAQDILDRPIELTDALDEDPRSAETVTKPTEDPKQSHSDELKLDQQGADTNCSEEFKSPTEERNATQVLYITRDDKSCSFCGKVIDGNTKISFSEPLICCHPECLKCAVCAVALGDLILPMFLHDQQIHCDACFRQTLEL
ncbi:proteoglycan 4 isoform X1 [Mugil cephalus]|uniref:proteoglycan 4 isoform X1 n=1 Tax=Mugil cephalus TaxID=48193 RepID=UPI001FB7C7CE|nr:proteoglycan 4 isoform X1 [Mugil cephalus]XP_047462675.1 proteoglycan 4 isoform X1 [Mugil cephalus]